MALNNKIKIFIKIIIGAALLFLFVRKIDFISLGNIFKRISLSIILLAVLINLAGNFISTYKWHAWLPGFSYFKLLLLGMVGRFYSFVLPGQFSGELVKAYQLGKNQIKTETIVASVLIDKATGILGLLFVGLAGFWLSRESLPGALSAAFFILFIIGLSFLLMVRINFVYDRINKIFDFMIKRICRLEKILAYLKSMVSALRAYSQNFFKILFNIALGGLYQLSAVLIIFLFSENLGVGLALYDYLWIFGIISLALFLPITIGGFGVREGTFIGLLGALGVSSEKALALSVTFLGLQFFDALIGGLIELTKAYRLEYFNKNNLL